MDIVIAGAGSVGHYLVERLVVEHHNVVVIDRREDVLDHLSSQFDIRAVVGSASSAESLRRAGVPGADIIIAATDSDEVNLIACILAHSMCKDIRKIARVRGVQADETGLAHEITSIIDQFINPDEEAVSFLGRLFETPGSCEVHDLAEGLVRIISVSIGKKSGLVGKRLDELPSAPASSEILIAAMIRDGKLFIPRGSDSIEAGDVAYFAARPDRIDDVFQLLGVPRTRLHHVMIWGGGGIGPQLASLLASRDVKVKLIESNMNMCEQLAAELDHVVVLNGEGTDQELLGEEGIRDVDMFIAATPDDEDNILSAVLARRLGAKIQAVLISKLSYLSLVPTLGIDIVVNPRILAASSILKHVRHGSINSALSIRDDTAEVLEIEAKEGSKIVGKPLSKLNLPQGVLVAAVVQDERVEIASGATIIEPGNKVIIFADRKVLSKLERFLDVKFSFF